MNSIYSVTASAALLAWSLAPVYGAQKPKNESPASQAPMTFEAIDAQSGAIADAAFDLENLATRQQDPVSHLDGLDVIKTDINKIGAELQSLEAARGSLSEWEGKALDQILPLMHDAAVNAEKAIQVFNSDRIRLWASPYVDETATVSKDADETAAILRDYLKLVKTREQELQIEQSLGDAH